MRKYELMVLFHARLDESGASDATQKVADLLESHQGIITKTDVWGRRRLAYLIQKQTEATYVVFNVQLDPSVLKEIEFSLKLNEDVIRYLLVRDLFNDDKSETPEEEAVATETSEQDTVSKIAAIDETASMNQASSNEDTSFETAETTETTEIAETIETTETVEETFSSTDEGSEIADSADHLVSSETEDSIEPTALEMKATEPETVEAVP